MQRLLEAAREWAALARHLLGPIRAPTGAIVVKLSRKPRLARPRSGGRVSAVTLHRTADVVGDAGVVSDCVREKVGLCIAATMPMGRDRQAPMAAPVSSRNGASTLMRVDGALLQGPDETRELDRDLSRSVSVVSISGDTVGDPGSRGIPGLAATMLGGAVKSRVRAAHSTPACRASSAPKPSPPRATRSALQRST